MLWAKRFEEFSDHPKNQAAIMLGYQPYSYNRDNSKMWEIFLSNQNNYRFFLANEISFLDDPTPYLKIYAKFIEYIYRTVFGSPIYSYIIASRLIQFIQEEFNKGEQNKDSIKQFLAPLLELDDIEKMDVNKITLEEMATFIRNFLKTQSEKK